MNYEISYNNAHLHYLNIILTLKNTSTEELELQCPSWRPGRYELANFAKNIQKLHAENEKGEIVPVKKVSKDRWILNTSDANEVKIHYNYYAHQMDGGSSWLDEEQVYINFVNCMLYSPERMNEPIEVALDLPASYKVACGLEQPSKHVLKAPDFYRLADSPMIASDQLQHKTFEVDEHTFHLWFMGDIILDWDKIISDFTAYTVAQFDAMKEFPCKDYHYLFQILPYAHYHGVEHYNSTVITLGPSEDFHDPKLYKNLLGVSSHELFHTWNVIRIRPFEMMPYDFSKENYHQTGFVTEGVTTYYGDLFLGRGGAYSVQDYFNDLNVILKRHFDNPGRFNLSVAESSFDTWLDGYTPGIPNRKVSIYIKGAIAALILDLEIRKLSKNKKSMDDVMREMWQNFGKKAKGYRLEDYRLTAENIAGVSLQNYFDDIIFGKIPVENQLAELLEYIGCQLEAQEAHNLSERLYGFRFQEKEHATIIQSLYPESVASKQLALDDEIIAVDGKKVSNNLEKLLKSKNSVRLTLFRNHKLKEVQLQSNKETYYNHYHVSCLKQPTQAQAENFKMWLKQPHPFYVHNVS